MATWLVGCALAVLIGAIVCRMIINRKNRKGTCACGGDCAHCGAACSQGKR